MRLSIATVASYLFLESNAGLSSGEETTSDPVYYTTEFEAIPPG